MRIGIITIFTFIVILGVLLSIYMVDDEPRLGNVREVAISVDEGKVSFTDKNNHKEEILPGEKVVATPDQKERQLSTPVPTRKPIAYASPIPASTRNKHKLNYSVDVEIVDALGKPIPKGFLQIEEKQYSFQRGKKSIPALKEGDYKLTAGAVGYASAETSIHIPRGYPVQIVLEYVCTFDCVVYAVGSTGDRKRPERRSAEVILWEGETVTRPIPSTLALQFTDYKNIYNTSLKLSDEEISVVRSNNYEQNNLPKQGDILLGMSGCFYRDRDEPSQTFLKGFHSENTRHSPRLRIWDALIYRSKMNSLQGLRTDHLEWKRGAQQLYCMINEGDKNGRGEIVAVQKTNNTGRCRFENLPAGTYYMQARRGKARSRIVPLHPAKGGAKLFLSGNSILTVSVKRRGIPFPRAGSVASALVVLKSAEEDRRGLYTTSTGQSGSASFDKIPFGNYILQIAPPSGTELPEKTLNITVEEPKHTIKVYYEAEDVYTISGTVVRADNREPVRDFVVQLMKEINLSNPIEEMGSYGFCRSADDGTFEFHDVIPGQYSIFGFVKRDVFNGYLPKNGKLIPDTVSASQHPIKLKVTDHDVTDLEYEVVLSERTRFKGQVIDEDGKPVANAAVILGDGQYGYEHENYLTDESGKFDFTIITQADDQVHYEKLHAFFFKTVELQSQPRTSMMGRVTAPWQASLQWGDGDIHRNKLIAQGKTSVKYKTGETVSDLEVQIRADKEKKTIEGTIATEDGGWPENLGISAIQNRERYIGFIEEMGRYRVDWLSPGPVRLEIVTDQGTAGGIGDIEPELQRYCNETVELNIPYDQDVLRYDIHLQLAGYLKGTVIGQNKNPGAGVLVTAISSGSYIGDHTNQKGEFILDGLKKDHEYSIEVKNDKGVQKASLSGIIPSKDNIIIQITNED